MIRQYYLDLIREAFKVNPVIALLGPRQSGKTTLARDFIATIKDFNFANPRR